MVERDLAGRGIRDARVLEAMRRVPREAFVPEHVREAAYEDGPLPIGDGQTISQPLTVAVMLEAAEISPQDRILDVGTGSGYAAAVASLLAELRIRARRLLAQATGSRQPDLLPAPDLRPARRQGVQGQPAGPRGHAQGARNRAGALRA